MAATGLRHGMPGLTVGHTQRHAQRVARLPLCPMPALLAAARVTPRRRIGSGVSGAAAAPTPDDESCWPQPVTWQWPAAASSCDCQDGASSSGQANSSSGSTVVSLATNSSSNPSSSSNSTNSNNTGSSSSSSSDGRMRIQPDAGAAAAAAAATGAGPGKPDPTAAAAALPAPPPDGSLPEVPWGWGKIFQVMGLWLLAYVGLGQVVVPLGLGLAGVEYEELGARATALLHLAMDAVQLGVTAAILARCLREYRPRERGLFPLRWAGGRWLKWVAAGAATFPAVEWLSAQSWGLWSGAAGASAEGYGAHVWCAQLEASLGGGDWVTGAAYLAVVGLCAPLWEEAVFRGFLLASLARQMGARAATVASALLFALCHFRADTFAPLLVLGLVFGGVYLKTNNLLPSILCHSAWNLWVLAALARRSVVGV